MGYGDIGDFPSIMKGEEGRCYISWDCERYMIYPLNFKSKGKGYIPLDGGDIGDNPDIP